MDETFLLHFSTLTHTCPRAHTHIHNTVIIHEKCVPRLRDL